MVIELDHLEYGAPHARNSVVLVVFQWDQEVVVLTTYEGSVYILNGRSRD